MRNQCITLAIKGLLRKQSIVVFLLIVGIIAVNISCNKKNPEPEEPIDLTAIIPEATKIGANTFGCYINGELFVAATKNPSSVMAVSCSYNSISENELRIQGSRLNDSTNDNIRFIAFVDSGAGSYQMDVTGNNENAYVNYSYGLNSGCFDYNHNQNNPGTVSITFLDPVKRIISGTFQMDLLNDDCEPNLIKITDGRFDLTY